MKRIITVLLLAWGMLGSANRANAQVEEIAQLLLNVEKLAQFKSILEDMKKGYQLLTGGYNTVKSIAEGNFSIHKTFLDGLMQVSPAVQNYRKVAGIIEYQVRIVQEYKAAFNRFKKSDVFDPDEIAYLEQVYARLFNQSLRNLDELAMVITSGKLRMSDEERLAAIDRLYAEMEDKLLFLRNFNEGANLLGIQRLNEQRNIGSAKSLYGVQ